MFCHKHSFHVVGLYALLSATAFAAETDPAKNAALVHWQAFSQLPTANEELDELVTNATSVQLDDRTREAAEASEAAMTSLRRAASMPYCEWGLDFSAGPYMLMPHLSKARQLARYACLHTRYQFAEGETDNALKTIRDTLVLARHVGSDDILISVLVQDGIERMVFEVVANELPEFSSEHVDTLRASIESLPEGGSVEASLKLEQQVFVGWARRVLREADTIEDALRILHSLASDGDSKANMAHYTHQEIEAQLDGTDRNYEEIEAIFDLPRDEFQSRWDALVKRSRKENPYSAMVLPDAKSLRDVRDRRIVNWAQFRAALRVQRDGEEALESIADPFGAGPFQYTKLSNGFRLSSQFIFRGEPVTLTVGPITDE